MSGLLHRSLFRARQVRELDRMAIEEEGIAGAELMERAGVSAFQLIRQRWPEARRILVVCGQGNNAGDGYVVARHARNAGLGVRVSQLGDVEKLAGDALDAYQAMCATGLKSTRFSAESLAECELVVDAIFGTGLARQVAGAFLDAIESINASPLPVLALDVPSGLDPDTGALQGGAIQADVTASFVALKQGLFTGWGPGCCGEIELDQLAIPGHVHDKLVPAGWLTSRDEWAKLLPRRERHAHKGDFGHVLVVGSDIGYTGAARLAAEAAARVGAGLITIATRDSHAGTMAGERAELMCRGVESPDGLRELIARASVVAIGPGLGRGEWGRAMLETTLASDLPLVLDADALNILPGTRVGSAPWVMTPHPGEAARLLESNTSDIQRDRFTAIETLCRRYGSAVVLKGAGTLIKGPGEATRVCSAGNPGMGSGGMGDVLTGVIAGLIAQQLEPYQAACLGVCVHAEAGDLVAAEGERGMLARDLMPKLRQLVN